MAQKSTLGVSTSTLAADMTLGKVSGAASSNVFETVNQSMNVTDAVTYSRPRPVSISQNLGLTDVASRAYTVNADSTISMNQIVSEFNYVGDRQPVGHSLNLTQTVQTLAGIALEQSLGITDSVAVQAPIKPAINHFLGLGHHTSTPHRAWFTENLGITDLVRTPIPQALSNTINMTDLVDMIRPVSTMNITQAVSVGKGFDVTSNINITHNNVVLSNWIRSVGDPTGIGHSLTYYSDSPCNRKQYTPFQGDITSNTDTTPPPNELQTPQGSLTDRFSLYYPAVGGRTYEVTLRAPELDNRDRNAYTRVNRETRGGKLSVFADPDWPAVRTLAVTIIGLTETEVDELQTFLQATVGMEVGLTDWEGRIWVGFVTNPQEVATQDGKNRWTVTMEFQGEMDTAEHPGGDDDGMTLNLTHSATAVIV